MLKEQQSKTDFSQVKRSKSTEISATVFTYLHKKTRPSGCNNRCEEIEVSTQEKKSRKTYQLIKDLNKKWTQKRRTIRDKHRKTLQTLEEIKKRWTEIA